MSTKAAATAELLALLGSGERNTTVQTVFLIHSSSSWLIGMVNCLAQFLNRSLKFKPALVRASYFVLMQSIHFLIACEAQSFS